MAHDLAHTTRATGTPARLFDSNGAGVAADDLDGDGLPDIVLGNLEGENTILWNEGGWRFTRQRLPDRSTRAVALVDVDADGLLDIVTTHRGAGVAAFRNLGGRRFDQLPLRGVTAAAYSMAWADLDGDDDLDLVTGSYDAELDQRLRSSFLLSDGAGVFTYSNDGSGLGFSRRRLAEESQALATIVADIDTDGRPDIVVGNDFAMPDMIWRGGENGELVQAAPFDQTSAHTMSLSFGDTDNDGIEEMFATDMKPATSDVRTLAQWLPLMETMETVDDPFAQQRIRNVLQANDGDGTYREVGERAGVDAAGWAWSARFGDLDNDGDLDLHVANGMIARETFPYLAGAAIVEPNVTFVNRGDGTFDLGDWGLGSTRSGRGTVLVDLDVDGRLDVVVNNLASPSVAFENDLCTAGRGLTFALRQPGSGNTHAVGAEVRLRTRAGQQLRVVRSTDGYLSGGPSTLHFGVAGGDEVLGAEVRWPDGRTTPVETPVPGSHYTVVRS